MADTIEAGGRKYIKRKYQSSDGHGWLREVADGRKVEAGQEVKALVDEVDRLRPQFGEQSAVSELPYIPLQSQRQDSVADQLADLARVANRLGMYDAADWIKERLPS